MGDGDVYESGVEMEMQMQMKMEMGMVKGHSKVVQKSFKRFPNVIRQLFKGHSKLDVVASVVEEIETTKTKTMVP